MLRVAIPVLAALCSGCASSNPDPVATTSDAQGEEAPSAADGGPSVAPEAQPPSPDPVPEPPSFSHTAPQPIPEEIRAKMWGKSYHEGCPLSIDELAYLQLNHWGLDGGVHTGELIVAATEAEPILSVFEQLFEAGFPLQSMRLVHEYSGDDDASMADNNTSAFNCRQSAGSSRWSEHSYGAAIDINPLINPYVTSSGRVMPPEGSLYKDRSRQEPGMIVDGDVVVLAFTEIGWGWGGQWTRSKDYQHFSRSGR